MTEKIRETKRYKLKQLIKWLNLGQRRGEYVQSLAMREKGGWIEMTKSRLYVGEFDP